MDLGLKGKRVVITGGTRGIGAAMVDGFLAEGSSVHFCARSAVQVGDRLQKLKDQGLPAYAAACDVGDAGSYSNYLQKAISDLGGVDVFIANVSGGANAGEAGWQSAFSVDMMASVRGADAVIQSMAAQKSGAILFISSVMATEQFGSPSAYGAMKAALISYATQLSEAVGPHGIRVNTVSPGPIHVDDGFWGGVKSAAPDQYNATASRHHAKRFGTTEEVANTALFLCSERASWVTGTNLTVDGGFSKRIQF